MILGKIRRSDMKGFLVGLLLLLSGCSYQGDSGSCLIYKDKCVAVLSGMYSSPDGMFKLTAAMRFTFDPQDLKVLGL